MLKLKGELRTAKGLKDEVRLPAPTPMKVNLCGKGSLASSMPPNSRYTHHKIPWTEQATDPRFKGSDLSLSSSGSTSNRRVTWTVLPTLSEPPSPRLRSICDKRDFRCLLGSYQALGVKAPNRHFP